MKTDAKIKKHVMQEFTRSPSISHEDIGVAVSHGIVTLSGTVPSRIEKFAAELGAQRVAGVKAVVEKIEVQGPGSSHRNDQDIAKAVVEHLKCHSQVPDHLIKAKVENGWVELIGEVEQEYQRKAAEHAVRGVTGIKGIVNNIGTK